MRFNNIDEREEAVLDTIEKIEIMKAFVDGHMIKCRSVGHDDDWEVCEAPGWNFVFMEYRIG